MKKILYTVMLMLGLGIMYSCEKIDDEKSASVYLSYYISSDNGESMYGTRGANADVFKKFYEEIVSGNLAAPSYSLTFTEVNTGVVYTLNGKWASHDKIILKTGTYHVTGKATANGDNIQKECSLIFDEIVTIEEHSTSVRLAAKYDCALIIFNDDSIAEINNDNGNGNLTSLFKFEDYYYAFINGKLFDDTTKDNACIAGKFTDGADFRIFTEKLYFEVGKFYVYTSITSSFNLAKMEEGDIYSDEDYEWVTLTKDFIGNTTQTNARDYYNRPIEKIYVSKIRFNTTIKSSSILYVCVGFLSDDNPNFVAEWSQYYSTHLDYGFEGYDGNTYFYAKNAKSDYGTKVSDDVFEIDLSKYAGNVFLYGFQSNVNLSAIQIYVKKQ